jgi:glycosyltransferase involved in cell wall biosynthesis
MRPIPLVTVITVFLNAERFLRQAVESVFSQSFSDWELLLIDDGSSDRSAEIALGYAHHFPRQVRYLQHPGHVNRGISASQNLGIREAKGSYLAILDSDDVWLPGKLSEQVSILNSNPDAAMIYGQTRYWYSWSGLPQDAERDLLIEPGVEPNTLVEPPSLLIRFLNARIPIPCPSGVIIRSSAAMAVGGFEESFQRIFTDQAFFAKLCLEFPVFVSDRSWFLYRKHSESAVAVIKSGAKLRSEKLHYLNWLEIYLAEHQRGDQRVRRALKRARLRCMYPRLSTWQKDLRYRALMVKESARSMARRALPAPLRRWLHAQYSR